MANYWEQVADAYNEGYAHRDIQTHHDIQEWGDAPRPPIERAWNKTPISPTEDWLAAAGPPTSLQTIQALRGAETIDDSKIDLPMTPPSGYVTSNTGGNPWNEAGTAANRVAPDINLPNTLDQEATGDTAPWEVPNTNPGETGITNLATTPNEGPAQDI